MSTSAAQLAAELDSIRRQLSGLKHPQLAYSSIENGNLNEYDGDGTIGSSLGAQFDGSHMAASLNGPTPPTPSAPIIQPTLFGIEIGWDGEFTDAASAPMDFTRIEVHAGDTSGFDATTAATLVGTIETPRGATVVYPSTDYVAHYFKFYCRSLSGGIGPVSVEESGTALKLSGDDSDVDFSLLGTTTITYNPTAPGSPAVNDVWVDTDNDNLVSQWDGSTWVDISGLPIADAIRAAATAQTTADGKVQTFAQSGTPTASGVGDLWVDTGHDNKLFRWDGSTWQPYAFGDLAVSSVSAAKITAGILTANVTVSGRIATALTGARVEMNSAGFQAFDSGGNQTVSIDTTGSAYLAGVFESQADTGEKIHIEAGGSLVGTTVVAFYTGNAYETSALNAGSVYTGISSFEGSDAPVIFLQSGYFSATNPAGAAQSTIRLIGAPHGGPGGPESELDLDATYIKLTSTGFMQLDATGNKITMLGRIEADNMYGPDSTADVAYDRAPSTRVVAASQNHTTSGSYQLCHWSDYAETENVDKTGPGLTVIQDWIPWRSSADSKFTAPTDGFYMIFGTWLFASSATGARALSLRRNSGGSSTGGDSINFWTAAAAGAGFTTINFALSDIWMTAGDYLEFFAEQGSGGTLAMGAASGGVSNCSFSYQHRGV